MTGRTPILHSVVDLTEDVGRRFPKADFGRAALTELLQAEGIRYDRIEMVTRATLAEVMRIGYDKKGRHFEFQILRGPSDRFHTHVTIRG